MSKTIKHTQRKQNLATRRNDPEFEVCPKCGEEILKAVKQHGKLINGKIIICK
jgi:predicted RNA-binding Zn-ribbon protein involved in translation (DUF1610 family)